MLKPFPLLRRPSPSALEIFLAIASVLWGMPLVLLSLELLRISPSYPISIQQQPVIGWIVFAGGLFQVLAAARNHFSLRKWAAFGGIWAWAFVMVLFFLADAPLSATLSVGWRAVGESWVLLRLRKEP